MSVRFINKRFVFRQPDGTTIDVVGTGNQYEATFETLDGFTIVKDPASGYWEIAVPTPEKDDLRPSGIAPEDREFAAPTHTRNLRRSPQASRAHSTMGLRRGGARWEQRRLEAQRALAAPGIALAPPSRRTTGDFVGLVLLIDFSDEPATITREEVEEFCNTQGYSNFGNNGSVFDYFRDVSNGALRYTNIVAPYYRAQRARAYYTDPRVRQPIRAYELIREALAHLKSTGFDFGALTKDSADCAYAINVFYAGRIANAWGEGLWPHCHFLDPQMELAPDVFAHDYQITNIGDELSLGTFCHENGHMICDFPDLYDYGDQSSGVGAFCLMCAGNNDEKNPSRVGAYLRYKAGWGSASNLSSGSVSLSAAAGDYALHSKSRTEYFIVESRPQTGRDASLPAGGVAIWHVDELGSNENEQRTPSRHYECSLVQADGRFDLERKRGQLGDAGDLYGGSKDRFGAHTTPNSNWWNGAASGLELEHIVGGGDTATLTVK